MFSTSGSKKRAQIAILISYKIEIKPKTVMRQSNYVMIKGSIHQEDKKLYMCVCVCVCVHNIGAPKYIKQMLIDLKGEIRKLNY